MFSDLVAQQRYWLPNWLLSRYLLWTWPNSILMQKFPIGRWLGAMVFFWGITVLTAAACTNFAGIMVDRFFLGVFEASNAPIFALIVGQYYTRREQPLRACIWWASAGLAGFFGDSMALKIGDAHGHLSPWKVMQHNLGHCAWPRH